MNRPAPAANSHKTHCSLTLVPAEYADIWDDSTRLLQEYSRTRDLRLRNRLVEVHERLVFYVAHRFGASGGLSLEDLIQVSYMGLISALERFDAERGGHFVTYAVPTMVGVIKHYLRDNTWAVKVPRRLRELGISLRGLSYRLEKQLGRPPTMEEMGEASGLDQEKLLEAMDLEVAYQPVSLDAESYDNSGTPRTSFLNRLADTQPEFQDIEDRASVEQALQGLGAREREVIVHRFFGEASQSEVAARMGISQMHVSRLERRALDRLRTLLRP